MSPVTIALLIFAATIILIASGKFPLPFIALISAAAFQLTGILNASQAWGAFSDTTVIMFIGMFICGGAFAKTSVIARLAKRSITEGTSDTKIMATLVVMAVALSQITTATVVVPIMVPIVYEFCKIAKRPVSKFMAPMAMASMLSFGALPIGSMSANYLSYNAQAATYGLEPTFEFFTEMIAKLPSVIICCLFIIFFGPKLMPALENKNVDSKKADLGSQLSPQKEKLCVIIFALVMIGVITAALFKWTEVYLVAIVGACLMVFTGILKPMEAFHAVYWPTIFIYAGFLALGKGLTQSGAGTLISDWIGSVLGGVTSPWIITLMLFAVCLFLTQLMSNMAVLGMFAPMAFLIASGLGCDIRACMLAVATASLVATATPMANPSQAVAFDAGGYTMKDYMKLGIPVAILYMLVFVPWASIMYPAF